MKKKLLLRPMLLILLLIAGLANAQNIVVSGKVINDNGLPVPGASIRISNGKKGTAAGDDGTFSIQAGNKSTLVVSALGYATQEVTLNGTGVTITLLKSVKELSDVTVTALGVKRSKRNLTYSTQEVKGEVLANSKEPNLVNAMAGKVSGVQITSSSGTAGASSRIVIRGATSATGDNQALFVVDGVPINNDETSNIGGGAAGAGSNRVVDIDPAIIENITVLKGAAATALYGSSGAKGVVMITTKSGGTDKKPALSLSSDLSFEKPLLPERQTKYAQGIDGVFYDGENNKTSASWGPAMDTLKINGAAAPRYDPFKSFLRKGITSNSTVSVSGGGGNSGYYMSYSYFDQQGFIPKNDFKRHSIFAKYNTKIYKNLTSTFQLEYSNSNQTRLPEGASNGPLFVVLVQPISWNPLPALNPDGSQRLYRASRNAPLWAIDNISNASVVNRFIPILTVNYTPFSWLTITERGGADMYTEQDKYTESPSTAIGLPGQIRDQNINFRQFNNDLIVNAHKQFNKFDVNLLVGNNIYTNYSQNTNLRGLGLTIDDFNNVSGGQSVTASEAHYQQRKVGYYAQANIDYNRLLSLSLTGRYDGSSVLARDKNFYPYGSAALSFIFSELFASSLSDVMNFGKIRLSYSTVGNDGVGAYQLGTPYVLASRSTSTGGNFPYQGQPGFLLSSTLGNPTLQNERLSEYEAGLETRFLNSRFGFEASYFYRKSIDGIIPGVLISNATGYSGTTVNSASIENKGFEFLLNASVVKNNIFGWDLTFNFTKIRNKVLALYPGLTQLGRLIVGQPYNIFYGDRYERNSAGQLMIDATGAPIGAATQGIVGNANPDWLAGLNNSFHYKQFGLDFFFDMKKGGDVQNDIDAVADFYGTSKASENRAPFVVEGISVTDNKPNTVAINAQTYYRNTRKYESSIQDGTYIKLRTASLYYRLPPSLLAKTFVKSASISVTGRNLWIYSPHFTGADPEVSSYGAGNGVVGVYSFSTPTSRSINFSLKLGF
ncbi:MAG: SusC/RagA family TonB-linked outer membrane protein [Ferruginibacter sp.]